MSQICRVCLKITADPFLLTNPRLAESNVAVASPPIADKMLSCVPELDLNLAPNAFLCRFCVDTLDTAYNFRQLCLETEGKIRDYVQRTGRLNLENLLELLQQDEQPKACGAIVIKTEILENTEIVCVEPDLSVNEPFEEFPYYKSEPEPDVNVKPIIFNADSAQEYLDNIQSAEFQDVDDQNLLIAQSFDYVRTLRSHKIKEFKCDVCLHIFDNKFDLKQHRQSHTFECKVCGFLSKTRGSLKLHEKVHIDKPWKCDLCPFSSNDKLVLKAHSIVHTGQKPFCCKKCNRRFCQYVSLSRHKKTHDVFKCDKCNYVTKDNLRLRIHQRTHTGQKPFKCDQCDFRGASQSRVYSHKKTHAYYACGFCKLSFRTQLEVLEHRIQHVHKDRDFFKSEKVEDKESIDANNGHSSIVDTEIPKEEKPV